jgi:hypothetical protein
MNSSLALGEQSQTSETIWFYIEPTGATILRCDIGEIPSFKRNLFTKYKMPSQDNIAFTTRFEVKTAKNSVLTMNITTDDGFMVGYNQDPFEGKNSLDWGSWRYQPITTFSTEYPINPSKNIFVIKWFDGTTFIPEIKADLHLTQDPSFPWLSYEVCTKPNNGRISTGFFEKRWSGMCAKTEESPVPSFDIDHAGLVVHHVQFPYISLLQGSTWCTKSDFAFAAFRTITLLVRPMNTLTPNTKAHIFSFVCSDNYPSIWLSCNDQGFYAFDFFMKEKGHTYTPCAIGEWNLITLQFNGNEGIYSFTCVAESISNLQQSIQPYITMLKGVDVKGDILFRPIVTLSLLKHRGKLLLGSGFTGDIAWIHGFRDTFTESSLMDEIHRVVSKASKPIHTIKTNTDTSKSFFSRLKW